MRFEILGPLRVTDAGGADRTPRGGRERTALAALLLAAGQPVGRDRLVDLMWGDDPPATAPAQVHTTISRLRRALAAAGAADALATVPAGYRLRVPPDSVDVHRFDRLVAAARGAEPAVAYRRLRTALALWRGPALGGVDAARVAELAGPLDERRLAAVEEALDLALRLGHAAAALAELAAWVPRHPLREGLRALHLRALYLSGRRADALAAYRDARRALVDELGVEPGPELVRLHRAILAGEPLDAPPAPPAPPERVRCLPRALPDFTGRGAALAELAAACAPGPAVLVIDGMAGCGKTTLALAVAHRVAADFPDAQLYVDLQGHSEREPLAPAAALGVLLRQLGLPGEVLPDDLDGRAARWRAELADRRALVLLDNAADAAQVRPLLPTGTATCAIVTGRRRLVGLDGVRVHSLATMEPGEARDLLGRVAGPARVAAEPAAAAEVVDRCGYLPLAVRLVGARLAHRPGWTVADLARRLAPDRPLLPELAAGDRTVRSALDLSYTHLPEPAQRVFRLLAELPLGTYDPLTVAALADLDRAAAEEQLEVLVDHHLLSEPEAGRYRQLDLVREYAGALPDPERPAARARARGFWLAALAAVEAALAAPSLPPPPAARPDLVAAVAAAPLAWFAPQAALLAPLVRAAVADGDADTAWRLVRLAFRPCEFRGYVDEVLAAARAAEPAVEAGGDPAGREAIQYVIGTTHFVCGRYAAAVGPFGRALRLAESAGLIVRAAHDRLSLALVHRNLGEFDAALGYARATFADPALAADPELRWRAWSTYATVLQYQRRWPAALAAHRHSLALAAGLGLHSRVFTLLAIGAVRRELGELAAADRLLTLGLNLMGRTAYRFHIAFAGIELALLRAAQGRAAEALALLDTAGATVAEIGHRQGQARVAVERGDVLRGLGRAAAARAAYAAGAALAEAGGYRPLGDRARAGLAALAAPPAGRAAPGAVPAPRLGDADPVPGVRPPGTEPGPRAAGCAEHPGTGG
ncbi:hypothetical protein GCM10010123_20870 [Pilimelia anulata]|uniref:OmpR/PhoB-type domain-containing protein n=1 Tax=Pilimelia anulata TaxID=53371 RepID=A0A8J3F8S9_9ACTN|nr:BTAD domain-containing putative transcriptional regulator [Pilimelia anulata]GGJ90860.1 hypothetical protein GCM10010123_20870 [Pilimelia anulata]